MSWVADLYTLQVNLGLKEKNLTGSQSKLLLGSPVGWYTLKYINRMFRFTLVPN